MISSPLMTGSYERTVPDYTAHNDREVPMPEQAVEAAPAAPAEAVDQPEGPSNMNRAGS